MLSEITADNVAGLTEVWRYRTGVEEDFKATPLAVDGRLYLCAAANVVIAIDGSTGEELWRHDPGLDVRRQVGDLRNIVDEFSSFARMPKPVFREENLVDIAKQRVREIRQAYDLIKQQRGTLR